MTKDKIRYRWPFDNWKNDGTIWEVKINNIIWMALLGFLSGSALSLFLMLSLYVPAQEVAAHLGWFFRHEVMKYTSFDNTAIFNYESIVQQRYKMIYLLWLFAYFFGFMMAFALGKAAAQPIDPLKHNRGRKLFNDSWNMRAFWEIFRISNRECRDTNSFHLPLISSKGLNPFDPSTYLELIPSDLFGRIKYEIFKFFSKVNSVVWFSLARLNTHILIFGSTRTGKSQLIKRMLHMLIRMIEIYRKHFANTLNEAEKKEFDEFTNRPLTFWQLTMKALGQKIVNTRKFPVIPKAIAFDTKGEYAEEIPSKYCVYFSVQDRESSRWSVARDLLLKQHAFQFFSGWIAVDPKQKIWGKSAINIGASAIVYNQTYNGQDWNLGNVAWYLTQDLEFKQAFVKEHFLEVQDTFNMAGETLGSVMGTFGAEVSPIIIALADIYCGYYYKTDIAQLTTTLLRREHNIQLISKSLFPTQTKKLLEDGSVQITKHPDNEIPGIIFRGLIRSINARFPLPETIYDDKKRPILIDNNKHRWQWEELVNLINMKAKDYFTLACQYLTKEEFNQITRANKDKFVSEFLGMTTETGLLEFNEFFHEKLKNNYDELLKEENIAGLTKYISPENQEKFAKLKANMNDEQIKANHKFFINGCLPILKNYRIWEHYETNIKEFSLRQWLYDPMPEKPIIIFKSSGEFKDLNNGIIRGMTAYMTGVIDSDSFADNNKLPAEKQRDIWIFCDEFPFFGDMKIVIDPILARGASKSVKLVLAAQDLSQFESEYDKEFVKFVCSNVGNTFVTGANAGETAERLSNIVGKKYFTKWHVRDNGPNQYSPVDAQEHEGVVLTPDEISSQLGAMNGMTRTLYLGARYFDDAYIFYSPIVKYPQKHKIKPAPWVENIKPQPKTVNIDLLLKNSEDTTDDKNDDANTQTLNQPPFDSLNAGVESEYQEEDQNALFEQEEEEFRKAQLALKKAQEASIDLPIEIDETELEEDIVAEKLIEELFGHEVSIGKISLELIDNFMNSRKVKITSEQQAIIMKYMKKKEPALRQRINIDDMLKD